MADDEFSIIDQYFKSLGWRSSSSLVLGPGDDCAIMSVPQGHELCISTDTFLSGVHFPPGCDGSLVAKRSFAAAVSDLAAMGAETHGFTGALTMPTVDHDWLSDFSEQLARLSNKFRIPLVGGNLTRGPLSITLTVMGITPVGAAIRRGGASPGDDIYVTGYPGNAGAGLRLVLDNIRDYPPLIDAYESPEPRIKTGIGLRPYASAAIDISDGLLADLSHLLQASNLGAEIDLEAIPLSDSLLAYAHATIGTDVKDKADSALSFALTAGDDYELCFTAPASCREEIVELASQSDIKMTRIGQTSRKPGVQLVGEGYQSAAAGYQHF